MKIQGKYAGNLFWNEVLLKTVRFHHAFNVTFGDTTAKPPTILSVANEPFMVSWRQPEDVNGLDVDLTVYGHADLASIDPDAVTFQWYTNTGELNHTPEFSWQGTEFGDGYTAWRFGMLNLDAGMIYYVSITLPTFTGSVAVKVHLD